MRNKTLQSYNNLGKILLSNRENNLDVRFLSFYLCRRIISHRLLKFTTMKNLGRLMLMMLLLVVGSASVEAQNWAGSVSEERVELRGRDRELRDIKAMRSADFKKF